MRKILIVTAECRPFAGESSVAEIIDSFGKSLVASGYDARIVLPFYSSVPLKYFSRAEYLGSCSVMLSWRQQECRVYRLIKDGVTFYLLGNDYYFDRKTLYGHLDDIERFAFFSKAVLDSMEITGFYPDIIHATDWQTALVPVYLKINYSYSERYRRMKTLFTIQHIERQGKCDTDLIEDLFGISRDQLCILENGGKINLVKGAVVLADYCTTVSPTYAAELKTSYFAMGLESIIGLNSGKLRGIMNGVDYDTYDPKADELLFAPFSAEDTSGKTINKAELEKRLCLSPKPDVPIIGMVTKLMTKKGIDIVKEVINEILSADVRFIMLAQGDMEYARFFCDTERRHPAKMRFIHTHDEEMAHKLFAASDYYLMPSQNEPCGRSQMIALRYGAVPIVRRIGGLADSISDVSENNGNGYVFDGFTGADMMKAVKRAIGDYGDTENRAALVRRAMTTDFSWRRAAEQYAELYEELMRG